MIYEWGYRFLKRYDCGVCVFEPGEWVSCLEAELDWGIDSDLAEELIAKKIITQEELGGAR